MCNEDTSRDPQETEEVLTAQEAIPEVPQDTVPEEAPETPREEIPEEAPQPEPQAQEAPRRVSPYANSPFESPYAADPLPPKKEKKRRAPRPRRPVAKPLLTGVLALAVLAGSCGLTYSLATRQAEAENARTTEALRQQIAALEKQMRTMQVSDGISHSGSGAVQEGLTPGQVYARNVGSVVGISCETEMTIGGQTVRSTVTGSGFILTQNGYIVTNYHVVENAQTVTVTTQAEDSYPATVIGRDNTADMALLKIEAEDLPAVTLGSSSELIIGDMVVAIGNPLGVLNATQTVGYISGINREVTTDNNVTNMLQTDAAINSGNSGGPLFNMKGEVVGIITAKYSGTSGSGASIEGIGFAIPIDDLKRSLEDLQTQGYIRSAYLGIQGMDVSQEAVTTYGLPSGAYVQTVTPDSPAAQAGLAEKDIIIGLGDSKIDSFNALARALRNFTPGDETTVTVYRAGKELTLPIILGEKPREEDSAASDENMPSEGSYEEWFDYFNRFKGQNP